MIERGVMVMKDGQAWQVLYDDGRVREEGWGPPETAHVHNPTYVHKPEDLTYKGSHYVEELRKGKVVPVEREITVRVLY